MTVRGLDINGDWLFGKGTADYLTGQDAIEQLIRTRLLMFLNDCFFAANAGIDWFTYLGGRGSNNTLQVELACAATIINTFGVSDVVQVSATLVNRILNISYNVQTIFSSQVGMNLVNNASHILTEAGDFLDDESGNRFIPG